MDKKVCSLDSLLDSWVPQVYICLSKNDYFALRLLLDSLHKKSLMSDEDYKIVERFNNGIIDIVDCLGTSLFDSQRV